MALQVQNQNGPFGFLPSKLYKPSPTYFISIVTLKKMNTKIQAIRYILIQNYFLFYDALCINFTIIMIVCNGCHSR